MISCRNEYAIDLMRVGVLLRFSYYYYINRYNIVWLLPRILSKKKIPTRICLKSILAM